MTTNITSPFLRLPPAIRQHIYTYLLPPHLSESVTTINYDLDFPFLQHPSSTTFTPHQLDLCRCPQTSQDAHDIQDHIYTRHICRGPDVRFHTRSAPLWILQQPGPAFNILRPATPAEVDQRPNAGILMTCKQVYEEALPLLYRGRNFLLLTGICSRGRHQAYATQTWLQRLSPQARKEITSISLLIQPNEEDCRDEDAEEEYRRLVKYVVEEMQGCTHVCLNVWPRGIRMGVFGGLLEKNGMCVVVMDFRRDDRGMLEFRERQEFERWAARGG